MLFHRAQQTLRLGARAAVPGRSLAAAQLRLQSTVAAAPAPATGSGSGSGPGPSPSPPSGPTPAEPTSRTGPRPRPRRTGRGVKTAAALALAAATTYYLTDTRAGAHSALSVPLIRLLYPDAEDSHGAAVDLLRALHQLGLNPRERPDPATTHAVPLQVDLFPGRDDDDDDAAAAAPLAGPLGISAGLDKRGEIVDPLFDLGASVVEIGGVTLRPQPGNPRPRLFRLSSQQAAINRYGLNSDGADAVARRLEDRVRSYAAKTLGWTGPDAVQAVLDGHAGVPPGSLRPGSILAVQIAKNKETPENDIAAVCAEYAECVARLGRFADVLVVNVSSPNTPGLRSLQDTRPLTELLSAVVAAAEAVPRAKKPAVMVKISPDEDSVEQVEGICDAVYLSRVDGVIVGNTTRRRPFSDTISPTDAALLSEMGGYSGPLMFPHTRSMVARYRSALTKTPERLAFQQARAQAYAAQNPDDARSLDSASPPESNELVPANLDLTPFSQPEKIIFASGGIKTADDVLDVLNAGASVAMMYTAITMNGLGHITKTKQAIQKAIAKAGEGKKSA